MGSDEDKMCMMCGCGSVTLFFVLVFTLPFLLTRVPDTERGVAYSTAFARFQNEIMESGGIQTRPYAAKVFFWPRTEATVEFRPDGDQPRIVCNSEDGLRILLDVSFQYFPEQDKLVQLTQEYGGFDQWRGLLISQAESEIRHVCGEFSADDFQTARGAVALQLEQVVRNQTGELLSAEITKLQLVNVNRVAEYENAVRSKENARSEISLAENERSQAITKAETTRNVAIQEQQRILNTANTTAQIITAQANATAEGIKDRFEQLAAVYKTAMDVNGFDTKGILTYISNEIFHNDVTIAVEAPVQITFRDEL
eukprot:maker-scaffold_8-snap-gene-12.54-mRNA-1 protein AED:0.32 eAED:0.32 QI:310/1/1/1/1/1/2/100/311